MLRAALAETEPPSNGDIGLLVVVQAGIYEKEASSEFGFVEVTGVGGELTLPADPERRTRVCFRVEELGSSTHEPPSIFHVLVYPHGRSTRLFAELRAPASESEASGTGSTSDGEVTGSTSGEGEPTRPSSNRASPSKGCPRDYGDRAVLASLALLVPPDEDLPDAEPSTDGTGIVETGESSSTAPNDSTTDGASTTGSETVAAESSTSDESTGDGTSESTEETQ